MHHFGSLFLHQQANISKVKEVRCAGNVHATKRTQEKNEETRKKKGDFN
jgi:hypothetical protein